MDHALLLFKRHQQSHVNTADLQSTRQLLQGYLSRRKTSPSSAGACSTTNTVCSFYLDG